MLFGVDLPTEPAAIEILYTIQTQHKENFELRRFEPGRTIFHPKFSIFVGQTGTVTAIIGSSNLTEGGSGADLGRRGVTLSLSLSF